MNNPQNPFSNHQTPKDYANIYPVFISDYEANQIIALWRKEEKVNEALLKVHGTTYFVSHQKPRERSWTSYARKVYLENENTLLVQVFHEIKSYVFTSYDEIDWSKSYEIRIRLTKKRRVLMEPLLAKYVKAKKLNLAQEQRDDEEDERRKRKYFEEVSAIHETLHGYPLDIADIRFHMDANGEISCSYKTC